MMNVLIVVAHPDDEVLGMGGTIAKHSSNGDKVSIIYLTTGITSRRNPGYSNKSSYEITNKDQTLLDEEIKKLKIDALKSNKILGITDAIFYNFPDNELDSIPRLKIIKVIEKQIEKINPDIVFTNHYGDLNIDQPDLEFVSITPKTWPNRTLGCVKGAKEDESGIPGFQVSFAYGGDIYGVRTNQYGSVVKTEESCE